MGVEFWIKIVFFKKKNYKISFELKLLPKVVRLGYIGDNMTNAAVLNNDFTIFFNSIAGSPFFKVQLPLS